MLGWNLIYLHLDYLEMSCSHMLTFYKWCLLCSLYIYIYLYIFIYTVHIAHLVIGLSVHLYTSYLCKVWVCFRTSGFLFQLYFTAVLLTQTNRVLYSWHSLGTGQRVPAHILHLHSLFLFLKHFSCRSALCLPGDFLSYFVCFRSLTLLVFK